jgi:hypothetical protein
MLFAVVFVSGLVEIAFGVGLLIRTGWRPWIGWALPSTWRQFFRQLLRRRRRYRRPELTRRDLCLDPAAVPAAVHLPALWTTGALQQRPFAKAT